MPRVKMEWLRDRICRFVDGTYGWRCQQGHQRSRGGFKTEFGASKSLKEHDGLDHSEAGQIARQVLGWGRVEVMMAVRDYVESIRRKVQDGTRQRCTLRDYEDCEKALSGFFEGMDAGEITQATIDAYESHRRRTSRTKGHRIVRELKVLRMSLSPTYVPMRWKIPSEDDLRPEHMPKRRIRPEIMKEFVRAVKKDRARAYLLMLVRTPMRGAEIRRLKVADIQWQSNVIRYRVWKRKKVSYHTVGLTPDLRMALERITAGRGSDQFVFVGRDGVSPITPFTFRSYFKRISHDLGLVPPIVSVDHDFRRNVFTEAIKAHGKEWTREWTGHASITILETHYDLDVEKVDERQKSAKRAAKLVRL